uniref:Transmembrane protein n=1 Tax=Trypanosoma congolense (strain IL3000) TaxID=1068625 RepID=G0UVW0_TRYCI|nr:conserved hypothetical protein [Trypanosoma congolense IL3000]
MEGDMMQKRAVGGAGRASGDENNEGCSTNVVNRVYSPEAVSTVPVVGNFFPQPCSPSSSSSAQDNSQRSTSTETMADIDFYCGQRSLFQYSTSVDYFVRKEVATRDEQREQSDVEYNGQRYALQSASHCVNGNSSRAPVAVKMDDLIDCSVGARFASPSACFLPRDPRGQNRSNEPELQGSADERAFADSGECLSPTLLRTSYLTERGLVYSNGRANSLLIRVFDPASKVVNFVSFSSTDTTCQYQCPRCNHAVDLTLVSNCPTVVHREEGPDDGGHVESPPCSHDENVSGATYGKSTSVSYAKADLHHRPGNEGASFSYKISDTRVTGDAESLQRCMDDLMSRDGDNCVGSLPRSSLRGGQGSQRLWRDCLYQRQPLEEDTARRGGNASLFPSLPTFSPTSFVRAYVGEGSSPWEATLDNVPAITVSCCVGMLNFVAVQFLRHHVIDTRDHFCLFVTGTYMIFSSYFVAYYFLGQYSESFRRISQDKQFYTIANLIKAGILASLVPFAVVQLSRIILFDEWDTNTLRNLGCIYTIPDFVSMLIIKRMSWSTWIHHLCVLLFNFFSTMNDYAEENVCRCVVVYAAFSTFAYCVNVLLASRFIGVKPNVAHILSYVSVVAYIFFCGLNWFWQVYYVHRLLRTGHDHWTVYVYMVLVCLVMYDDIVLCQWLIRNAKSTSFAATHHKKQQRRQ